MQNEFIFLKFNSSFGTFLNLPVCLISSFPQPVAGRTEKKEECPCTDHWGCHCVSGGTPAENDASGFAYKAGI